MRLPTTDIWTGFKIWLQPCPTWSRQVHLLHLDAIVALHISKLYLKSPNHTEKPQYLEHIKTLVGRLWPDLMARPYWYICYIWHSKASQSAMATVFCITIPAVHASRAMPRKSWVWVPQSSMRSLSKLERKEALTVFGWQNVRLLL